MRQPNGPGDIIEIDVIDADPGVFGPSAAPRPARDRRPHPRWLAPTAIGVAAACATVAVVWQPWERPPEWRTFGPAAPATSSLSDRLILDLEGASVTSLHEGGNLDADEPTPLGHVFAVPGGSYEFDAWALFHSRGSNAAGEAVVSKSTDQVHGLPADVRRVRVRTTVTWGPIGGNYWDSQTNRLEDDDALAFANAVGVVAGLPAVAYGHDMGALEPVGDVKTLARVQVLASYLGGEPVLSKFAPTVLTYSAGGAPVAVASIGTDTDGLAMARFYLGQGRDVTVHGMPGAILGTRQIGKVVVWHEGDRLVVVAAEGTDDELLAIAETVRPATATEWNNVLTSVGPATSGPDDAITATSDTTLPSDTIAAGTLLDGSAYRVSITLGNPTVICAHVGRGESSRGSCVYATPLSPATHAIHDDASGAEFVVAVVPDDNTQLLRITSATGEVSVVEQRATLSDSSFAIAALLPDGATYELAEPATLD